MPTYTKDPDALLDYGFDWSTDNWLDTGEIIATSTWTVPSGLTEGSNENDGTTTKIWLSGGTVGERYEVVNHIVTDAATPREDDRTIVILIRER